MEGAIKPWIVDHSALVPYRVGPRSPVNTAVWYFQLGPMGEIRVIDCDLDLDIPPVERVARMLAKGIFTAPTSCRTMRRPHRKAGARS